MRTKKKPEPVPLHREHQLRVTVKLPSDWSTDDAAKAVESAISRLQADVYHPVKPAARPEAATVTAAD